MFRASDVFGRRGLAGAAALARSGGGEEELQAKKRTLSESIAAPTTRVWDPAHGKFVEEDLPAEVLEMMGMQKKAKVAVKAEDANQHAWAKEAPRALSAKTLGLSATGASKGYASKVKLEAPKLPNPAGAVDKGAVSVEFKGFGKVELNERYYEKVNLVLHGKETYWTEDGQYFLYWQGEVQRWAICDGSSLPAVRAGQYPGWSYKADHKHFSQADGWLEAIAGEWKEPHLEVSLTSASHQSPLWEDSESIATIKSAEFHGFSMKELNTRYTLREDKKLQGKPSYWDSTGTFFIYWQQAMSRWAVCDLKCLSKAMQGQSPGWAYRSDDSHFANACGWMENRSDQWAAAIVETSVISNCTKGLTVEFHSFYKAELNTTYTEKQSEIIQGKPSFWDPSGQFLIYWQSSMKRWAVCDAASLRSAKQGLAPGWAYRTDSGHFARPGNWLEAVGRDWRNSKASCVIVDGVVKGSLDGKVKAEEGGGEDEAGEEVSSENCRNLIERVYLEANPSKLGDVDMLMTKWAGREEELYRNICQKYGYDADEFAARSGGDAAEWQAAKAVAEGEKPIPGDEEMDAAELPDLDPMQYAVHIQAVYEQYNPSKLADLGRLLQKYRSRERTLYLEVCKKYGEHPVRFYYKQLRKERGLETTGSVKQE